MVSVNVAQLLQELPGAVREFDFADAVAAVAHDVALRGPVRGHARLTRTNEGILVHASHTAPVTLECSRCLNEVHATVKGTIDEEFLPSVDLRTGIPLSIETPGDEEQPLIDAHHEIDLDEILRQNILTNLPLRPLCEASCPGLCPDCGERLDRTHRAHAGRVEDDAPVNPTSPFAQLASLLNDVDPQER
ncbi:MAG TPA: DUF177 domain-containing protein [Chloroflexota bacterium]|jgi:uncharacterized protein